MWRTPHAAVLFVSLIAGVADAQDGAYLLQPGDRIAITVLEDPSLNRTVLIGPDGRISLPLAGSVQASNLSVDGVTSQISKALAQDFVTPPTVTVSLVDLNSPIPQAPPGTTAEVYVLGQVATPGAYTITLPADLLQLLARVGGPGAFAATDRIQLRRRVGDVETLQIFNYDVIEVGLLPTARLFLQDGDIVVVPERGLFD